MQYLLDEICQFSFVLKITTTPLQNYQNTAMFKYDFFDFLYVHQAGHHKFSKFIRSNFNFLIKTLKCIDLHYYFAN